MALEARDLTVSVEDRRVLHGVTVRIEHGEIVALMGPNGSGKTSLAYTLMGHPRYVVEKGSISLDGEDITKLPPHERARKGLLLVFQNPIEIPGVRLLTLLAAAYNRRFGVEERLIGMPSPQLIPKVKQLASMLGLSEQLLQREVNVGFSGGERKRSEILQLLLLEPRYAVLDEPDSGLDVDGIRVVADAVRKLRDRETGVLLITHYARILEFLEPDHVLVLANGRIVAEGGPELARRIEREGYASILRSVKGEV